MTQIRPMLFVVPIVAVLSACAGPESAGGIYDPLEPVNRKTHQFNKDVDRTLLRPLAQGYGNGIPEEIRIGVGNFASNLTVPGAIVNDILQLNIEDALHNTARFIVNSTIGLGGILDPATEAGVPQRDATFGETLHVWGFGEGAFVELPFLGPSTTRDAAGGVVDIFLDPIGQVLPAPERYVPTAAGVVARVGDRYRFQETVDSILYDSADSYAQARTLYLQNRRFALGGVDTDAQDEELYDIYEEAYE